MLVELGSHVSLVELIDLRCHSFEKRVTIVSFFARRAAGVASVADQISDDFGLWVVLGFDELAIGRLNDAFKNRFCFALVEDGVVTLEPDEVAVHAKDSLSNTVKSAAPKCAARNPSKVFDPFQHLMGGFIGEGE